MLTVAIDGPAGAGKSTIARQVARSLGARFLDTGALYRAVTAACLGRGVDPTDGEKVAGVARDIVIELEDERVMVDGFDMTDRIRAADVTQVVSTVSQNPAVRAALLERQRSMARRSDLVAEGRDMATVVFPDADLKVYLTASLEVRARRRAEQLGLDESEWGRVADEIRARDEADSTRSESPLSRAPDAVELDTTDLTPDEVVARIVELAEARR